jgi:hypothetical protein
MGILDDAIREHIDLKRKHGARDSEISEIEDEALGSGERPDPFAAGELFGGVSSPAASAPDVPEPEMGRTTPPPDGPATPPPDGSAEAPAEEPTALVESPAEPSEPPTAAPPEPSFPEPPPAEPSPPERPSAPGPPAESESLEDLMAEEEGSGPPESSDIAVPPPPPPETESARPEPPTPLPPAATEGQRGRARGRADVPTQEHIPPREETGDVAPVPGEPEPPEEGAPQLYDFETDPGLLESEGADLGAPPAPAEESDDFEALGPVDEAEKGEDLYGDEEPYGEQRGGTTDSEEVEGVEEDYETGVRPAAPPPEDEEERYRTEVRPTDSEEEEDEDDLLSESPEFLDKDDDESLWFEKGPPKDFDFEDEDEDER